jgi:GNAT superfamily N-acetyltransferase
MRPNTYDIRRLDIPSATKRQWDDFVALQHAYLAEFEPDDPLPDKDTIQHRIETLNTSKRSKIDIWLIYDGMTQQALGYCNAYRLAPASEDYESKKHIAYFNMFVLKERRRRGIGSQLLRFMATQFHNDNHTRMETGVSTVAGNAFMTHWDAQNIFQVKTNRLPLLEVDWSMVEQWATAGKSNNSTTDIHIIDTLPEAHILEQFADLQTHIYAQMPKDDASGFPELISAEALRERFETQRKEGYVALIAFTLEADGTLSAMTETRLKPAREFLVYQGLTGVHNAFRGKGLGKWLKAAMLLEIRTRFQGAAYIEANNANVNAPMLYINEKLGYKLHKQYTTYKLQIADVINN